MDDTRVNASDPLVCSASMNALALLNVSATAIIGCLHPFGEDEKLSSATIVPWIVMQSMLLVCVGWLVGRVGYRLQRRWIVALGFVAIVSVPTIALSDAIVYGWTRERFLSVATYRVFTELRPGLWQHAAVGTLRGGALLVIVWGLVVVCLWIVSRFIAARHTFRHEAWFSGFALLVFVASTPALICFDTTLAEMRAKSSRHPLCIFRVISHGDAGPESVTNSAARNTDRDHDLHLGIAARANQQRQLRVIASPGQTTPDVLIVVVESFRQELVCKEVMPHLWEYASRGILCRKHFSGGNATNHGFFSLMNGLEAIWHDHDVRFTPILNRLMSEAGYEIGFFAGHDDWRLFRMDGYVSREHFDVFRISQADGLRSDRMATQRAANFLDRIDLRGGDHPHRPRLAVLYLYATHADYQSYPEDQVFQPAADNRFLIPFTSTMSDQVWNRYKNSARTVDRFLSAVMREDRVVIVTGDHGESFLEDGVCGHGVRISKFQNMTPAVIFRQGGTTRKIDIPTMHADILPTLLSMLEIELSDTKSLDGIDLSAANQKRLLNRTFTTRNYLNDDIAVIVSSDDPEKRPFAYRGKFSIRDHEAIPLNPINELGQRIHQSPDQTDLHWNAWLKLRFETNR
jgi:hypothetical protein